VILKSKLLDKYLNLLLIFLFPTQLALHFWPNFAFVFGIRVDYLSPTIYLTDLLFISLFVPWIIRKRIKAISDIKKYKYLLLSLSGLIVFNLFFSSVFYVSFIKWLKIIEFIALGYYVKNREDRFNIRNVSTTLFYSLIFFSFIGVLQFFRGRTLGNILYLLGERSFTIFTPGIALVNLFGDNRLRIYSTFSHPNSFAGFLGASLIFLYFNYLKNINIYRFFGLLVILSAFVLTFSLSAFVGLSFCLFLSPFANTPGLKPLWVQRSGVRFGGIPLPTKRWEKIPRPLGWGASYFAFKKHIFNVKGFNLFIILFFLLSFYFSVFSGSILESKIIFSQSFSERLELADIAGKIFSGSWITGVGLNNFVINEISYAGTSSGVWLLQPVHNIYLLLITEIGILGILLLYYFISLYFVRNIKTKNIWGILIIFFVLTTGLFDHYWFTIQQNMLLLSLFLGISSREKI